MSAASLAGRVLVGTLLSCALSSAARADPQGDRMQSLEKRLEASVQLIDKLSARIAELERAARPAPVAAAPMPDPTPAAQAQAIAALQEGMSQLSAGLGRRGADAGLPVHGFADVGAAWSSKGDPARLRGFNGGTLDLYFTPQFSDRVKGLIEIAFEYGDDGGLAVDMERLQLGYTVNDSLTLWMGRFHAPFGIWNTAYHHGAHLQTSISRPRFIDFEDKGGILPVHSVGAWASGKLALGSGRLLYDAYIANGPRIAERTLDFQAFNDDGANKLVGASVGYRPGGTHGALTLGVHAFGAHAKVYDTSAQVLSQTRMRMLGAYVGYDDDDWELIGEYYRFANTDLGDGQRRSSQAGFVQLGKTIGAWSPFMRYEKTSLDPQDNYFRSQASGQSYQRSVIGLRYALDAQSSFKLEFGATRERAADLVDETGALQAMPGSRYRRGAFQYSVAF